MNDPTTTVNQVFKPILVREANRHTLETVCNELYSQGYFIAHIVPCHSQIDYQTMESLLVVGIITKKEH